MERMKAEETESEWKNSEWKYTVYTVQVKKEKLGLTWIVTRNRKRKVRGFQREIEKNESLMASPAVFESKAEATADVIRVLSLLQCPEERPVMKA